MDSQKSEQQLEFEVNTVMQMLRQGKKMTGDHRYNLERHEWGFDNQKGDYYHKVESMAPEVETRLTYAEENVRYWVKHWLSLKSFEALAKEQGWDTSGKQ